MSLKAILDEKRRERKRAFGLFSLFFVLLCQHGYNAAYVSWSFVRLACGAFLVPA